MTRRRTRSLCACGHGKEHHTGPNATCVYGHTTITGGCTWCGGWGKPKRHAAYVTTAPTLADLERLKHNAQAALDALCACMRTMLTPPPTSNGTSFENASDVARVLKAEPPLRRKPNPKEHERLNTLLRGTSPLYQIQSRPETSEVGTTKLRAPPGTGALPTLPAIGEVFVMKKMHRKILTALAQHPAGLTKGTILLHAGYAATGHVSKAFAALGREGLMSESPVVGVPIERDLFFVTDAGLRALGSYDKLPVGRHLLAHLLRRLATMDSKILSVIAEASPAELSKNEILDLAEYSATGHVSKAFARLVRLHYVVKVGKHKLRLSDELTG